jgi:hypothetical protein
LFFFFCLLFLQSLFHLPKVNGSAKYYSKIFLRQSIELEEKYRKVRYMKLRNATPNRKITMCKTYRRAGVVDVGVLDDIRNNLAAGDLH